MDEVEVRISALRQRRDCRRSSWLRGVCGENRGSECTRAKAAVSAVETTHRDSLHQLGKTILQELILYLLGEREAGEGGRSLETREAIHEAYLAREAV